LAHEKNLRFGGKPADLPSGFDPIQTRKSDVEEYQIGLQFFGFLNRF
jgi:hypothetical protein